MSGRLYFNVGELAYFARKGSVDLVRILDRRDTPGSFGDQQYRYETPGDPSRPACEGDWTHESWFCFTKGEAEARRDRWRLQQNDEAPAAAR